MNADTLALARASSPAKSTSSGRPWARTWPKTVLNAFTTCALAGAALAISCAPEVPSGVTSPVASALKVLEMSMMTLPASASPYWATTGTALAYGTARMTMSPAGAVPNVPAVAPPPSAAARSLALAASRPMTSTALPPSTARAPMARAMPPRPIMLMLLMVCLLSGAGQDAVPAPSLLTAVSSVPPNDAVDGARFLMCSSWPGPCMARCRILVPNSLRPIGTY